jgi:hypothetical protein
MFLPVTTGLTIGDSIMSKDTMTDDYANGVLEDLRTLESLADILDDVEDEINAADDQELGPDDVIKLVELTISNAVRQVHATPDNDAADVVSRHLAMFNEYRDSDLMTDAIGMGYGLGSTLIQAYFADVLEITFEGVKSYSGWDITGAVVLVSDDGPNTYVVSTEGSVEVRCYWGNDKAVLRGPGLERIGAYLWELAESEDEA